MTYKYQKPFSRYLWTIWTTYTLIFRYYENIIKVNPYCIRVKAVNNDSVSDIKFIWPSITLYKVGIIKFSLIALVIN